MDPWLSCRSVFTCRKPVSYSNKLNFSSGHINDSLTTTINAFINQKHISTPTKNMFEKYVFLSVRSWKYFFTTEKIVLYAKLRTSTSGKYVSFTGKNIWMVKICVSTSGKNSLYRQKYVLPLMGNMFPLLGK